MEGNHEKTLALALALDRLLRDIEISRREWGFTAVGLKQLEQSFKQGQQALEAYRQSEAITITQPIGNCDGSGLYAYDATLEDGRGEKLAERCPGCRACR